MTPDELLLAYRAGNAPAGAALIQCYESLARSMAWRYRRSWLSIDDLRQVARLAAWRSIMPDASTPFDPERGNLTLWIRGAMNSALSAYVRKERKRQAGTVYLDDWDINGRPLLDVVPSDDAEGRRSQATVEVSECIVYLDALSEKQRRVLTLRYLEGLTLRDAAKAIGKSHQDVLNWERRGLEALRRLALR